MKVLPLISVLILIPLFTLSAGGKSEEPKEPENTMVFENTMMMIDTSVMESEEGPFIPYKDSQQVMMLAEEMPTVLFFNASWCPTCREAREDFIAHELQKKYGVTYQHTFVQIDTDGEALATWNGGGTDELLANIVKKDM